MQDPAGHDCESRHPVRFGVAGLGGFAAYVTDRLIDQDGSTNPSARLVGACDPHLKQFGARAQELRSNGATVVKNFEDLLTLDIDAVWLPVPIDLHRPFTEAALAAGKAVLCEKPAAGSIDDVLAMIGARNRAKLPVLVGFQDLYQPAVAPLKQRILSGEFGRALTASVIGCWPRGEGYFRRNDWAGRLQRQGRWIMDSPAANALSHFLHLPLHLLGKSLADAAMPTEVAAELYRANDIENYDTCSIRLTLPGDVPLIVAYTHACDATVEPLITIQFEEGRVRYFSYREIEIQTSAGVERIPLSSQPHRQMLATFESQLRGAADAPTGATLEMSAAQVAAMNAASEFAPVHDVPAAFIHPMHDSEDNVVRTIRGIVPALQACAQQGCLLHETGLAPWAQVPKPVRMGGYSQFAGPRGIVTPKLSVQVTAKHARRVTPAI